MEKILARFMLPDTDPTELFVQLIDAIRPHRSTDLETAKRNLQALCHLLSTHLEFRAAVREKVGTLSQSHRHSELYIDRNSPKYGFC